MKHLVLALLLVGCTKAPPATAPSTPVPAPEPAAPAPVEAAPEPTSVKPGINDNFLDPELDVKLWIERFEGESREVFAHRDAIVGALGLADGMAIADIGAGTGLFEPLFANRVGADGKVYAVDISPRFLDHLRERAQESGLEQVVVVEGTERSVELEPGTVDVVFVCDTYHHFEYPHDTLQSIHAALKPGGHLVVVDFVREEGVSRDWILGHVRAGKDVFAAEVVQAGFEQGTELDVAGLEENYAIRFRRP